jgi:hypothetical protein
MFKTKYRIIEYIKADGQSSFHIEKRFHFFFWYYVDGFSSNSLDEARSKIDRMLSDEIVSSKIYY